MSRPARDAATTYAFGLARCFGEVLSQTRVWLFGSITRPHGFNAHSDVDAVEKVGQRLEPPVPGHLEACTYELGRFYIVRI